MGKKCWLLENKYFCLPFNCCIFYRYDLSNIKKKYSIGMRFIIIMLQSFLIYGQKISVPYVFHLLLYAYFIHKMVTYNYRYVYEVLGSWREVFEKYILLLPTSIHAKVRKLRIGLRFMTFPTSAMLSFCMINCDQSIFYFYFYF